MAIPAFREFGHNALRMLFAVAGLAGRYHFVLVLMTECAGEGAVLYFRCGQHLVLVRMTGCAINRRRIGRVGHVLRHVNGMAFAAVSGFYIRRMRLVALQALRFLAVNVVAR